MKGNVQKAAEGASSSGFNLNIEFDNNSDPTATVITVSGQDQTDLLAQMTGAFNSLDMVVKSANISTDGKGQVMDAFRVVEADDKKVILHVMLEILRKHYQLFCLPASCLLSSPTKHDKHIAQPKLSHPLT